VEGEGGVAKKPVRGREVWAKKRPGSREDPKKTRSSEESSKKNSQEKREAHLKA